MTDPLPHGWRRARIATLADVAGGLTRNAKQRASSTDIVPLVTVGSVGWRDVRPDDFGEIGLLPSDGKRAVLEQGDVLVVEGNGSLSQIGRVALWDIDDPNARHQNHLIRVRCGPDMEPAFLLEWLASPDGRERLVHMAASAAGLFTLNLTKIRDLEVPVPRMPEQLRIVARLNDLLGRAQRVRETLADVPTLLEQFRQSILDAAFRGDLTAAWREAHPVVEPAAALLGRLRAERRRRFEEVHSRKEYVPPAPVDPEAEDLPELPAGWEWATLEELTDSTRLIQYGILKPGPDQRDGVPYVKVRNMKGEVIDVAGLNRTTPEIHAKYHRSALLRGDLLISIRGSYGGVALVPDELDGANITQDSARIAPLPGVDRGYLRSMLRAPVCQAYLNGVAKGMAVRGVNIGDLRPTRVPLAPEQEQREVIRRIEADLARVRALENLSGRTAADIATLARAVLAKAFRGELAE